MIPSSVAGWREGCWFTFRTWWRRLGWDWTQIVIYNDTTTLPSVLHSGLDKFFFRKWRTRSISSFFLLEILLCRSFNFPGKLADCQTTRECFRFIANIWSWIIFTVCPFIQFTLIYLNSWSIVIQTIVVICVQRMFKFDNLKFSYLQFFFFFSFGYL